MKLFFKRIKLQNNVVFFIIFSIASVLLLYIISSLNIINLIWAIPVQVLLFYLFMYLTTKSNKDAIKKLVENIKNITEGKHDFKIAKNILDRNDEIGLLATSISQFINLQQNIFDVLNQEADKISDLSSALNSDSLSISREASEQAASVEEISASMEQMLANIDQNSENSKETEQIANKSATNISVVNKAVENAISTVKSVIDKISIINNFAKQTNILAINAAIEAARAGSHGKGFAVVATEVRKLAENSQLAANDIGTLTNSSIQMFDRSVRLLQQVIPEIQKTSGLIKEISSASLEQRTGAEQINSSIQQLNLVTQKSAAMSDKLLSHSEAFMAFVINLKKKIKVYK